MDFCFLMWNASDFQCGGHGWQTAKPNFRKWVMNSMYYTDRFAWNYTKSARSSGLCHGQGFSSDSNGGVAALQAQIAKFEFWTKTIHEQASLKSWKIKHFKYLMWNQAWENCVVVWPWLHFADFFKSIFSGNYHLSVCIYRCKLLHFYRLIAHNFHSIGFFLLSAVHRILIYLTLMFH